ncbi:MAG: O-antigen ligase family protein, partial [Nitrospirota bacterium]
MRQKNMLLVMLCLVYAGIIAVNSTFHGIALNTLPDEMNINLMQHKAVAWRDRNLIFTLHYLFFPLFFLIQYALLRRVERHVVIRFFASAMIFSLLILFYQKYYDIALLNQPYWQELHRIGGLSTDPNAFAMTAFLLLPLFALSIYTEKTRILKIFYMLLIVFLFAGVLFAGSRTALCGLSLLILSLPVIHALAKKEMPILHRLALFISPFVLLLLIILLLPYFSNKIQFSAISTERFISTIKGFKDEGISSALFKGEQRATNYLIAWDLLASSPLAGWGPGGFYKESPTLLYLRTGTRFITDSALNHYLMIGGDFGLPILLINMVIIVSPLVIAFIVLRKLSDIKKRYIVGIFLVVNILFLIMINTIPPSYFPDL